MSVRALAALLFLAACADPDEITDKDSVPVEETDVEEDTPECFGFDVVEV